MLNFKRIIAIVITVAVIAILSGCSGESSADQTFSEDTGSTRSTDAPTAAPTESPTERPAEKPTEKPTEAPTEKPTESVEKLSSAAYLEYLQDHSDVFSAASSDLGMMNDKFISIFDVDGDGISELIYVRSNEANRAEIYLDILTYSNGEVISLYDGYLISTPGQGPSFSVFIGDDGALYSVASNGVNSTVTEFDVSGASAYVDILGSSKGIGSSDPTNLSYEIDGDQTSGEEYYYFMSSVKDKAVTHLICCDYRTDGNVLSLTYGEAVEHLSDLA